MSPRLVFFALMLTMKQNVAVENFDIFMKLKPHEKVMCSPTAGKIKIDTRYLNGVWRTITGDSRERLIDVLSETLNTINIPNTKKLQLIAKLSSVLSETYPVFQRLSDTIAELCHKYNHPDGESSNAAISSLPPVCLNQTRLMHIRYAGRISDKVWKILAEDMWISGALCDFILEYPTPNALFDLYIHKVGVHCGLFIIEPDFAFRRTRYIEGDTIKRLGR